MAFKSGQGPKPLSHVVEQLSQGGRTTIALMARVFHSETAKTTSLRTASACRKPRLVKWSSRCNARTSPPENHGSRIESGTTDKGLSLRAEPAPDLIRGPAIQEVMDAGSESGMTARRETVIAGSTRNPGSHGSRVKPGMTGSRVEPGMTGSWIPGSSPG